MCGVELDRLPAFGSPGRAHNFAGTAAAALQPAGQTSQPARMPWSGSSENWMDTYGPGLLQTTQPDEQDWTDRFAEQKLRQQLDGEQERQEQPPPPPPPLPPQPPPSLEQAAALAGWSAADLLVLENDLEQDLATAGWSAEDLAAMLADDDLAGGGGGEELCAPAAAPPAAAGPAPPAKAALAAASSSKANRRDYFPAAGGSAAKPAVVRGPGRVRIRVAADVTSQVTFPYDKPLVAKIKGVGGGSVARWVGRATTGDAGHWAVPAGFLPQLLAAFPGATVVEQPGALRTSADRPAAAAGGGAGGAGSCSAAAKPPVIVAGIGDRKNESASTNAAAVEAATTTAQLLAAADLDSPLPNGWTLFEHQKQATTSILKAGRAILAYDMGLGKTVIGLCAARAWQRCRGWSVLGKTHGSAPGPPAACFITACCISMERSVDWHRLGSFVTTLPACCAPAAPVPVSVPVPVGPQCSVRSRSGRRGSGRRRRSGW
eukprot:SAG22_NODE_28_length_28728_cov_19.603619_13_plen_489_part_00